MNLHGRASTALVLLLFAAVFVALTVSSYTQKSATWDEPQHLTAGYTALKLGDFRTDPEHPPFIRIWAALPLLANRAIHADISPIEAADPMAWVGFYQFIFCHDFLYRQNDADRLLYPARFMIVCVGVVLGILVFCWTRELFGFWPAVLALGCLTLEPNILAHSSLVTTDFAITCFTFGTIYFAWRTNRRLSPANMAGLTVFFALAHISKFSAILLGPLVAAFLVVKIFRKASWAHTFGSSREFLSRTQKASASAAVLALLAVITWGSIWAAYGFRFLPSASPTWKFQVDHDPGALERTPVLTRAVGWADSHRLLPNAYSQGFLLGQAKAQKRGAYLAGELSTEGWWYYFPVAVLIKTPISFLLLFFTGVALCAIRWRSFLRDELFLALPLILFAAVTMTAKLNIGLRHILPIYPFALVVTGGAIAELLHSKRRVFLVFLGLLAAFWVFEFARVWPHYLAFFNSSVGGPANGYKYLVDSNLDWGQDLKPLKKWMDKQGLQRINHAYFGTADPAYYNIHGKSLPGGPFFLQPSGPELPGYVAASVTVLTGVYLSDEGRAFYKPLLEAKPTAVIGHSIRVYWAEQTWW